METAYTSTSLEPRQELGSLNAQGAADVPTRHDEEHDEGSSPRQKGHDHEKQEEKEARDAEEEEIHAPGVLTKEAPGPASCSPEAERSLVPKAAREYDSTGALSTAGSCELPSEPSLTERADSEIHEEGSIPLRSVEEEENATGVAAAEATQSPSTRPRAAHSASDIYGAAYMRMRPSAKRESASTGGLSTAASSSVQEDVAESLEELATAAQASDGATLPVPGDAAVPQTSLASAAQAAGLATCGSSCSVGQCKVQNLGDFLERLALKEYTEAARSWCVDMGAVSLEEIAENIASFSESVGLKPLEWQRAWKWSAQVLALGEAALVPAGEAELNGDEAVVELPRSVRLAMDSQGNMGLDLRWDLERGVLVEHVDALPGQPGLSTGDYIISVDGFPLRGHSHEECYQILAEHLHDGAILSTVTLVPANDPWAAHAPLPDDSCAEGRGRGAASTSTQGDVSQKTGIKARGKGGYRFPGGARHQGFSANKMWHRFQGSSRWPPQAGGA